MNPRKDFANVNVLDHELYHILDHHFDNFPKTEVGKTLKYLYRISDDFGLTNQMAYLSGELGVNYFYLNKFDLSKKYLEEGIRQWEICINNTNYSKDEIVFFKDNQNCNRQAISVIYIKQKQYDLALDQLENIIKYSGNSQLLTTTYLSIGQLFLKSKNIRNTDKSFINLNNAIKLAQNPDGKNYDLGAIKLWLGHYYLFKKQIEKAKQYYQESIQWFESNNQIGSSQYKEAQKGLNGSLSLAIEM